MIGRTNAVIMSGGFLINPDEVDEALLSHAAVAEAATVGMPDDDFGEIAISAVVLAGVADELSLTAHCSRLLEPKKVPKRVLVLPSIPRGDVGKPQLERLRSIMADRLPGAGASSATSELADIVVNAAAHVFRMPPAELSLDSSPQTIAQWDSFAHIVLILEAEQRTHRHIPASVVGAIDSLRKLVDVLQQAEVRAKLTPDAPPYGVFIGTSLAENALPSGHPAHEIFATAGADDRIVTIASANQSETQILAQTRRSIDMGVKKIFVEINPFLLTLRFERRALRNAARSRFVVGIRNLIGRSAVRLRTKVLAAVGLSAYAAELTELRIHYPATVRGPCNPQAIAAALHAARHRGLAVIWVVMPRSQRAADYLGPSFEAEFAEKLHWFAGLFEAEIWRPADFWPNEYFLDNAHLNAEGRTHFLQAMRRYGATHAAG